MKIFCLALIISLVCATEIMASRPNPVILREGQRIVELVFQERFAEAQTAANNIIRQFPDSPAGHFFLAATLHYRMIHLRNTSYQRAFLEACERGIAIGEQRRNQGDEWNDFFLGATIGVQGAFERINGRLVSSLRLATRAMEIFRSLDENQIRDVLYGTGVYDYWIGANARLLWWMPGVRDNRPRALANLATVREEGLFTRQIVKFDLMEMFLNERRWQDAADMANEVLRLFPTNSAALWTLFEAYDALRQTAQRDAVGQRILARIEQEPNNAQMLRHFQQRTRRH